MEPDDPFAKVFGSGGQSATAAPPPQSEAGADPFASVFTPPQQQPGVGVPDISADPELDSAKKRADAERNNILNTIVKLRSTVPQNEGHKARLDKLVGSLETQLQGKFPDQGTFENFMRGGASGLAEGLEFPVALAGYAGAIAGHPGLRDFIDENSQLLDEQFHPRGVAGTVGNIAGNIVGGAASGGGIAEGTGEGLIKLAPNSRVASLIAKGATSRWGGAAVNVLTGLPIQAITAAGGAEIPVPDGATEEEADRIRQQNLAAKLKQFAIGVGMDAAFGAAFHGKPKVKDSVPGIGEPGEGPSGVTMGDDTLTPERQAQLDKVKAQNAVKVAIQKRERINKSLAQSEWQIMNPDLEWKELDGKAKKDIYKSWNDRRSNSDPNTSAGGTTSDQATQVVGMDEALSNLEKRAVGRDEEARLAYTDHKLGIGNDRALDRARVQADKDPNLAYLFFDVNGLKGVNDAMGMDAGTQLLRDSRDAILAAHTAYGQKPRLFRYGGDEMVAIVPKEHAQTILQHAEDGSVKQYGDVTGSVSGVIHSTLDEALSLEGKAQLSSRKIEAKARQNIPGRDAQEQALIDAVKMRQVNDPAPVVPEPVEYTDPFPPEAMEVIHQVSAAGGLRSEESQRAFSQELVNLYNKHDMKPEDLGSELQTLVEDFTPLNLEDIPELAPGTLTAAIKMPDGTIHTGVNHGAARWDAGIRDNPPDIADGFVTKDGQFLDRTQAHEYAQQNGIPTAKGTSELLTEDFSLPPDTVPDTETHVVSIEVNKPLEQLTDRQLDAVDDKLLAAIEEVKKDSPEYAIIQRDLDAVGNERTSRKGGEPPKEKPADVTLDPDYSSRIQQVVGGSKPKEAPSVLSEAMAKIRKMSPRKMTDGELELYIRHVENERRRAIDHPEAVESQRVLDKALEERAFRDKAKNGQVPQIAMAGAFLGKGGTGFIYGITQPIDPNADEDQQRTDRITNGLLWAGVTLAGVGLAARMKARSGAGDAKVHIESDRWAGSSVADAKIVNQSEIEPVKKGWTERARGWYTGIVRRTYGIDRATETLGGSRLAASKNPAKLISMFGRWVSQAEGALMDRPSYTDLAGNVVPLDAPSYRQIADLVGDDLKGLGKLMAARTSVEGQGLRKVPFDPVTADLIIRSAGENYHQAADLMRKFDLSMAKVLEMSGVLTPGSTERFAAEEFYAALHKVFDPEGGTSKIVRDSKGKIIITSPNPVKGRTGGHTGQVFNPAETTAAMVPQIYRAAELSNIKNRLVDLWEAAGMPKGLLEQVERRRQPINVDQQLRIDALKQEVKGLTQADAEHLVASFDPKSLDPRSNIMTVHRDGVLRSYKVDETIATAMASLHPDELEGIWKVLGLPASVARKGVVLNPFFVAKQGFIDNWQATLNSTYGFRFGIDQFLGWTEIVRHTPEYQKFLAAGGGHSTLQSHEFTNVKTALKAIKTSGNGPLDTAVKQVREFRLVDAYKTLITPFSEAARVGEYLRARGHGASVLDAVYAAKHVTANFQQRGGFQVMRGLDRASMFLNPALQGLDQAAFRAGINPFRVPEEGRAAAGAKYLAKAFISITLPSMYFWSANKDDQEINDLRQTDSGQKYWFMRSPVDVPKMGISKSDIIKIPKPIVDGQLFGSSMEATLDKMYKDDPQTLHTAMGAMAKDLGFNILPTLGVMYLGLETNKNLGTGGNIIPGSDAQLALQHQGEDKASWLARTVSKSAAPLVPENGPEILKNATTPAGLDYIMNTVGGMIGQDGLNALTLAAQAEQKGYVPAKEELPIVSRIFTDYPIANVAPVQRFYDRASAVQTVGATMVHLMKEDPESLPTYMAANQSNYALVGVFDKTRQQIANYRRAIQDIKDMPGEAVSSEDRRTYIKQYLTLMIETARQANTFAKAVDDFSAKPPARTSSR